MANITRTQYQSLKRYLGLFSNEGKPCYRFYPNELNDGLKETDWEYMESLVFCGTRNPWNAAQRLVAFYPFILDRI